MAVRQADVWRGLAVDWEQEARIAVWRAVLSYDPDAADASTPAWFVGTAIHRRLKRLAHVERRRPDCYGADGGRNALLEIHKDEPPPNDLAPVVSAVGLLSPRQREVLALRFRDGCSQAEAGRRLGVSQAAVQQTEQRALRELREILAPLRAKEAI